MEKYIIRKCPNCLADFRLNCQGKAYNNGYKCTTLSPETKYCKDITDCLLKQIVEKCKENYISDDNVFDVSRKVFAQQILDILEIEEVNE